MIERLLFKRIQQRMFKGKIIALFGARRVGKTVLAKQLLAAHSEPGKYISCDLLPNKIALESASLDNLRELFGDNKIIVLDEAQRVRDIGLTLKIIADELPQYQIIATGSSSFDLANKTAESLTGRAFRFLLLPFGFAELKNDFALYPFDLVADKILRFGLYPPVFLSESELARDELNEIAGNYLYKDVLEFDQIKRSDVLLKLLQALSLQLGSEVSTNELSQVVGISRITIEKYIDLLEKCFVLFRLRPLSRNRRNEISGKYKVFFYDLGIRNSLAQNFAPLAVRTDLGALWENFCIVERIKRNGFLGLSPNYFFWRTYDGKEIDFIEEQDGAFAAFEFKWRAQGKTKAADEFIKQYPGTQVRFFNKDNFAEFLKVD